MLSGNDDGSVVAKSVTSLREKQPAHYIQSINGNVYRGTVLYTPGERIFCDTEKEARCKLNRMGRGFLNILPWRNVIIAGGSVLAAIARSSPNQENTDIDIYVFGEDAPASFANVLQAMHKFFG